MGKPCTIPLPLAVQSIDYECNGRTGQATSAPKLSADWRWIRIRDFGLEYWILLFTSCTTLKECLCYMAWKEACKKYTNVMKHGHLMQRLEIFVQLLSLRSTQVVRSTRETGDMNVVCQCLAHLIFFCRASAQFLLKFPSKLNHSTIIFIIDVRRPLFRKAPPLVSYVTLLQHR